MFNRNKSLSMNSHVGISRGEYETLKVSELPGVIYNRILYKIRQLLGDKAESFLAEFYEAPFKTVANSTGLNLWDCFFVYPD